MCRVCLIARFVVFVEISFPQHDTAKHCRMSSTIEGNKLVRIVWNQVGGRVGGRTSLICG